MLVVGAPFTTWFKAVSDMVLVGDLVWTMVVPWTKVRGGACVELHGLEAFTARASDGAAVNVEALLCSCNSWWMRRLDVLQVPGEAGVYSRRWRRSIALG